MQTIQFLLLLWMKTVLQKRNKWSIIIDQHIIKFSNQLSDYWDLTGLRVTLWLITISLKCIYELHDFLIKISTGIGELIFICIWNSQEPRAVLEYLPGFILCTFLSMVSRLSRITGEESQIEVWCCSTETQPWNHTDTKPARVEGVLQTRRQTFSL